MQLIKSIVLVFSTIALPLSAQDKVRLQFANINKVAPGLSGTIRVADEPSTVTIHYRWQQATDSMSAWYQAPAQFDHNSPSGTGIWSFAFVAPNAAPSAADFDFYVTAVLPYGRQQDGSEQNPYRIGNGYIDTKRPRMALGESKFGIESAYLSPRSGGSWFITAWTQPEVEEVSSVLSFDGWKSTQVAKAMPAYGLGGLQVWFIPLQAPGLNELCMAFELKEKDGSFWANNEERNYCFKPAGYPAF